MSKKSQVMQIFKTFCFLILLLLFIPYFNAKRIIRTVAGIPPFGGDGKLAIKANLFSPTSITETIGNEFIIADSGNHIIRKVDKHGIITTIAGIPGVSGYSGDNDLAINAKLEGPICVFYYNNEIYICDSINNAIRKISPQGIITTIVGGNGLGSSGDGGLAIHAQLNYPSSIFIQNGEMLISDAFNKVIRKVFANQTIITVAGVMGQNIFNGEVGQVSNITLNNPSYVILNKEGEIIISDTQNNRIRKVHQNGTIVTVAGSQEFCEPDSSSVVPALQAKLCYPMGLSMDYKQEELYIASYGDCSIRKLMNNGTIITVAGQPTYCGYTGDFGPAKDSKLFLTAGVYYNGAVYICDTLNNVIRKISKSIGFITPFAGFNVRSDNVEQEFRFTDLANPSGIYVTKSNQIYVADTFNHVLKRFDSFGTTKIIAGIPDTVDHIVFENVTATNSTLYYPESVFVNEETDEIFIADRARGLIRKVDSNGLISTVAGSKTSLDAFSQNALQVKLRNPSSIHLLNGNELFIADSSNHVLRKVFLQIIQMDQK